MILHRKSLLPPHPSLRKMWSFYESSTVSTYTQSESGWHLISHNHCRLYSIEQRLIAFMTIKRFGCSVYPRTGFIQIEGVYFRIKFLEHRILETISKLLSTTEARLRFQSFDFRRDRIEFVSLVIAKFRWCKLPISTVLVRLLSLSSNTRHMFLIGGAVYSWAAFIRTCSFSSTCSAYLWAALHREKTAYGHLLYKERRFALITELSALLFSKNSEHTHQSCDEGRQEEWADGSKI